LGVRLDVSDVTAAHLVKQMVTAGILKPATGKHRRSALYQADDILDLLAFGSEADPRAPAPEISDHTDPDSSALLHHCGAPTGKGPCRNRVAVPGSRCWRHRDR